MRSTRTSPLTRFDLGTYGPVHLESSWTLRETLVESADESGSLLNNSGLSILRPCRRVRGVPDSSQQERIALFMRCHHASLPGLAYDPLEPIATRGHCLANRRRRRKVSCMCQTGQPCHRSNGQRSRSSSFSSSATVDFVGYDGKVASGMTDPTIDPRIVAIDVDLRIPPPR